MAEYPLSDAQIMQLAYKVRGLIRAESRAIPEVPAVNSLEGISSMPVVQSLGGVSKYVRAPLALLVGETGATPILTFKVTPLAYGSDPTVSKSGTAESPTITIGFPLAKNGDNTIMKKGPGGIYSKLESAPEADWQLLFTFDEVMPDVSDFSPEGIAILQQPAREAAEEIREQSAAIALEEERRVTAEGQRATAETARATAEGKRVTAETARATAETNRVNAESSRATAETGRATAEGQRVTAETTRATAEGERVTAETARATAETNRADAESSRATAETGRATAESQRVTAETARATAEGNRATAETARATAETNRADAETSRATAETGRATAEGQRVTAETTRATAEGERVTAETARIAAETQREEDTAERLENADNAVARLNDLSDHRDKIVGGYWWRWNEATEQYENTGYNAGLSILGYYDTMAQLRAGVSNPNPGDAYGVGVAAPYDIYIYDGTVGDWINNGQLQGADGADGKSAYRIWLDEGNTGTETDFLASLKGRAGDNGLSAYQLAVAGGFSGTVSEWLASLEGSDGDDGLSAYQLAVVGGFSGTVAEWLASLNGQDGADGRDFTVPDLAAAPDEDTLTYEVGDEPVAFRIGQLARVFDTKKDEYVFYQLYDISSGSALWKLAGSGGGSDEMETVIVNLTSNQGDVDSLHGASIIISYGEEREVYTWTGMSFTVRIPAGEEYTIEVADDLEEFSAPEPITVTAFEGYIRMVTLTCLAELARISAQAYDGGYVGGQILVVTETATQNVRYQGVIGTGIELLFPYGVEYRLDWPGESDRYLTPASSTFTAAQRERSVVGAYASPPSSQIIFDKTIADPANITGDVNSGAVADIFSKMRRCLVKKTAEGEVAIAYLDNEDSTKYADGTTAVLTGTEGDVMVYKPEFYYKYEKIDDNKFAYRISEYNIDGDYIHSPASLIGAYKSYSTGNKLYSRSGVSPTFSITQANSIVYAQSRGTGYDIIDFEQHSMIALLFFAKYGTRNSQTVLGVGNANYNSNQTTGSTNSRGNRDTANATTGYVNFLGIEGVHGGCYEWVGGLAINAYVWTATDPDGSQRTVGTAPSAAAWIMEHAAADGPYFDLMPKTGGASETTYYCDYYQGGTAARVLARSYYGTSTYGGVSYTYASNASSTAYTGIASRLAFRGVIREAASVQAFKALQVL